MNPDIEKKISKFLSQILRHRPEKIGLELDEKAWADVDELLAKSEAHGMYIDREDLYFVVRNNYKQRFLLSEDLKKIRANQGHSISVTPDFEEVAPPKYLFHGTTVKSLPAIRAGGILKMRRHHVHLSVDKNTAITVGSRHGKVVVLRVFAGKMAEAGVQFFRSTNGVWLTDSVAPDCFEVLE